jgi:hypothetical protein
MATCVSNNASEAIRQSSVVTKRYKSRLARNIAAKDGGKTVAHEVQPDLAPARYQERENLMRLVLAAASLAIVLAMTSVSEANAWVRNGSVTTSRGTYHGTASGGCAGGTCSRSVSVTGPYGGTVSRTGSITRVGPRTYDYTRTTIGPNGNSVTRSGTVVAYPHYGYRY